ncbi:MAG: hypothetical protein KJO07_18850 [Deltaproteobacteria bacterium]|nr:hypothetical protein [Deltaproteobacteria bacterium]
MKVVLGPLATVVMLGMLAGCSILIEADDDRVSDDTGDGGAPSVDSGSGPDGSVAGTPDAGTGPDAMLACNGNPSVTITIIEPPESTSSVGITFGMNGTQPRCNQGSCVVCPPSNIGVTLSALAQGAQQPSWNDECPECSFSNCFFYMPDTSLQCTVTFQPL